MDKKNLKAEVSYVIHSQDENEKSFSDDIGNSYEIVDVKKKNKDSPDGVWKYFSFARNICDGTGDKVVCTLCFEDNEIKTYSKVTSSSNLWRHLQLKHNIVEDKKPKYSETDAAISEMLREEGDDTVTYMEEVIVGDEKDMEDVDNKYVVTGADINVAIIEEIFKHPEIFDHRNHKSTKQDRDRHWDIIANHFKGTMHIEHIKKVWKNIRDRYKKLRNKELRTGIIPPPEKRYKYYDLLNELDVSGVLSYDPSDNNNMSDSERTEYKRESSIGAVKKRRISSNDEEFTNIEYLNDRAVHLNDLEGDDPLFEDFEEIVSDPPAKVIKTEAKSSSSMVVEPSSQPNAATPNSAVDDEFTLFGKLIAEKLRRMPKKRANRLEMKVMALLLIGDE